MALPLIPIIAGVGKAIGVLAKGAAKGLAKKAVAGAGKKMAGKIVGKGKKGGAIVVRQKTGIDKAAKIMGGKSSALAVIDKPKTQLGFRDINTQIDNIVGQTVSIRKIVVTQYALDKSSFEKNRKSQENLKRKKRESELERKKVDKDKKKVKMGPIPGGDIITRYLSNILLGGAILAIVKNLDKIQSAYDFALKNAHKIWLGVRYGLGALVQTVKGLSKFIKKSPWIQKLSKKARTLAKKVKINILKRFKNWNKAISSFGTKTLNRIKKAAEALRGLLGLGKAGKSVSTAISPTVISPQAAKTSRASQLINRRHGPAAQKIYDNAIKNGKSVTAAKAAVTKALNKGQIISQPTFGLSTKGKPAGRIFKHGIKRGANRVILKWFGPQAAKRLAPLTKTFKVVAKAAKGIKIPVVGPIIVLITSLLSNEEGGLNKALFKGFGTLFGGLLGSPLGPLGMILGEVLGEVFGEVLYEGFMGKDGWSGAGKLLKAKWDGLVKGSKDVVNWIKDGGTRFYKGIPKVKIPDFPKDPPRLLANLRGGNMIWTGLKGMMKAMMGPIDLMLGKEVPNLKWMVNLTGNTFPLLQKSLFPSGGSTGDGGVEEVSKANIESSDLNASKGVESSASYEEGAETVIPVPLPDLSSGNGVTVIKEKVIALPSSNNVNSNIKALNMLNLGYV